MEILTDADELPEITRRNTLIPPARITEVMPKDDENRSELLNKVQEQNYEDLRSTYKSVGVKEKKRTGIEEIFAKKTADLEMMLRGNSKGIKHKYIIY